MLTSDLLEVTVKGKEIFPKFLSLRSKGNIEKSELIIAVLTAHLGRTRGEIKASLQDASALEVKHKLLKGLAKVALDQSVFTVPELNVEPKIEARDLRRMVFERAVEKGPIGVYENQFGRPSADEILSEIASEIGVETSEVQNFLYADQREMNVLEELPPFEDGKQLIQRYNLALCQALLLRASAIQIRLIEPTSKWLALIFRRIKFYRLIFQIYQRENVVEIVIDGPQSLLKQSSRYGMQFALFLPVLPLLPFSWKLQANVLWGKKRKFNKRFYLDDEFELHSHYKARGLWKSNTEEWFEQRYREKDRGWSLGDGELVSLGGQQVLLPNFKFQKGDNIAYLEIIGFWQKSFLRELVLKSPNNVIFAVSRKYAGESQGLPKEVQDRVISFSEVISVKDVLNLIEKTIEKQ